MLSGWNYKGRVGNSARSAVAFVAEFANNRNDARRRAAIPELGWAGRLPVAVQNSVRRIEDPVAISTDDRIRSVRHRHRAFGVMP